MPAPSFLKGLPKPVLFALYGAVGGLLGALVFAEPLWQLLKPPPPAAPEPQVAVAASKEVEVLGNGVNTFPVQIDRGGFDGPVTISADKATLPAGVTVSEVVIPKGEKAGVVTVHAVAAAPAVAAVKLVAEGDAGGGKKPTATTPISVQVKAGQAAQADVFFVLDVTASMQWAIDEVKKGIGQFAADMRKNGVDSRIGIVVYRDLTVPGEGVDVLRFGGEPFTADPDVFRRRLEAVKASGGGDIPESTLEAVREAAGQPFRPGAVKVLLVVTDAPPKVVNQAGHHDDTLVPEAVRKAAAAVKGKGIDTVHLVINALDRATYEPLLTAGIDKKPGERFDLRGIVTGDESFDTLLATFGRAVTEVARAKNPEGEARAAGEAGKAEVGVKSLQSSEQAAAGNEGLLTLRSGLWAGAISALVCLALLAGQHHYLRGTFPAAGGVLVGVVGGLVVGLLGGAAGQGLYMLAPDNPTVGRIFQVFGWTLLGGLAGVGLSLFIPNLKRVHGLAGGAVGGAAGAVGYLAVSAVAGKLVGQSVGDLVGRLVGGLLLGLFIGLMVAIVEAAFRRAWLEVRYGTRETITVNLGPEPVKVGGDSRACTVWARGAAPLALRYFVRDGQIVCDDVVMKRQTTAGNGDSREVGNVTVTVRTGTSATPAGPPTRPTAPPPLPRPAASPAKAAAPLSLDDDPLDFTPVPPSAPKPAPVPPKPPAPVAAPRPPVPPLAPPRPPVPTAGAKPPIPAPAPKPAVHPARLGEAGGLSPPAPPAKPAPAPGLKHPDACPNPKCGRINPGRPGNRYCMVCDLTY